MHNMFSSFFVYFSFQGSPTPGYVFKAVIYVDYERGTAKCQTYDNKTKLGVLPRQLWFLLFHKLPIAEGFTLQFKQSSFLLFPSV